MTHGARPLRSPRHHGRHRPTRPSTSPVTRRTHGKHRKQGMS